MGAVLSEVILGKNTWESSRQLGSTAPIVDRRMDEAWNCAIISESCTGTGSLSSL